MSPTIAEIMDAIVDGLLSAGIDVESSDNDNDSGEVYLSGFSITIREDN